MYSDGCFCELLQCDRNHQVDHGDMLWEILEDGGISGVMCVENIPKIVLGNY